MKVLNVDVTIDPVAGGGCAERTFQMTRTLAKYGVECHLLILDIGLKQERIKALGDVNIHILPCLNERFYIPKVSIQKLSKLVRTCDIVHLMGHWELTDALIYPIIRHYDIPYVNCPAGSLKIQGRSRFIKYLYNLLIGNRIIRNASKLIAISSNEFNQFKQYGAKDSNIVLVPNGINPDDYMAIDDSAFRIRNCLNDDPFILFIGRLNTIKGPDLLLRAFIELEADYPDYHLVFAGPDEGLQGDLERMVLDAGISHRIHFTGFLAQVEKSMALNAADLLVIPSRSEAMSIVVLEAGAASTPVLATDQCGLNEIEEIGGGCIVPVSVKGLHDGLQKMLSQGNELKEMGKKLKSFVLSNYTWDAMADRLVELYKSILMPG